MVVTMSLAVLHREMYSVGEAADLLSAPGASLPAQTLRRWLQGYEFRGRPYPPVLRRERNGREAVTWAEFVEAGLLKEYRRRDVPLQRLRPMIDAMRVEFGIEYPLAHFRPLVDRHSREVLVNLQEQLDLDQKLYLIVRKGGSMHQRLEFSEPVEAYLDKVEFDESAVAERVHPLGKRSLVVIDPQRSFGIPTVRGIRTEILVEQFRTGEPIGAIADDFDLRPADVEDALRWELRAA